MALSGEVGYRITAIARLADHRFTNWRFAIAAWNIQNICRLAEAGDVATQLRDDFLTFLDAQTEM